MIKLVRNGDFNWSLIRIPDSVLYKKEFKRKRFRFKNNDWLDDYTQTLTSSEEIERISLCRTRSRIKEICLNNDFEYFGTMTVNSFNNNRFDLNDVQDKMKKLCHKLYRRSYFENRFKFVFITEKHLNGAYHFHGMFKNFPKDDLYINENGYTSSHTFDILGFNSFDIIKDYTACCHYITKYITKNCVKNENNQIYFCSRNLKKAEFEYMIDYDLQEIFPNKKVFSNNYCQKVDFDVSRLNSVHARNLNHFFCLNDEVFNNENNYVTNMLKLLTNYKGRYNIINR